MFIKLTFSIETWVIPQCTGGKLACLTQKPELVDAKPEPQDSQLVNYTLFSNSEKNSKEYYHDCQDLSTEQIKTALDTFNEYYFNSKGITPPVVYLWSTNFADNEIVKNLKIALSNITSDNKASFESKSNVNNPSNLKIFF